MSLTKRVSTLESSLGTPQNTAALWFHNMMKEPEKYEIELTAATIMANENIIERPDDEVFNRLWERLTQRVEDAPDSRLWFSAAYFDLDSITMIEQADSDAPAEVKDTLCQIAAFYYLVFMDAPRPADRHQCVLRHDALMRCLIWPLISRACPAMARYSTATFMPFLENAEAVEDGKFYEALCRYLPKPNGGTDEHQR